MSGSARNWGIGVSNEPRPEVDWTIYYVVGIPTVIGLFGGLALAALKLWM